MTVELTYVINDVWFPDVLNSTKYHHYQLVLRLKIIGDRARRISSVCPVECNMIQTLSSGGAHCHNAVP